jgi:ERCC4-related helicase
MTTDDFEVGDQVAFASGQGEIVKIDENPGNQSNLLQILSAEGELIKRPANLPSIEKLDTSESLLVAGDFDDPERFDLRTIATQMDLTHRLDRFVALTNSRIRIEPYQVKAAHEVLTSHRHRYLIGDEVGLGKTIEAGIVLEELIARGQGNRILIVTPAPLQTQWQNEMQEKFNRDYVQYDRDYFKAQQQAHPNQNAWTQEDRIITSIDFAKQDDVLAALENLDEEWDMAIFDEAHHLSARREGKTGVDKIDRFYVGEAVSENSDGLLFLTGTPHKGKSDQFYFMLRLLDRYRFEDEHDISPDKLQDIMVRRLKNQMYNEDGTKMFPNKNIETIPVHFTDEEQELYDAVTEYISEHYNLAGRDDSNATGFAMVLYQKRLVSSIHAIKKSLKNRLDALDRGGTDPGELSDVVQQLLPKYRRDPDMLTEHQREKIERELEELAVIDDPEQLEKEREIVQDLYDKARQVSTDSKADRLKKYIDGILETDPDEKVLVFTEYTDTLEYIRDEVFANYRTAEIYGDLNEAQRREQVEQFRENANIMLATDAAREGINLQFAHIMVNYDLPWNPIRIDQRIGRLHRYGQEHTVQIRNLFVDETRESEILENLFEKLEDIEDELGLRSDILGMVLEDFDLEDQIMDAVAQGRPADEVADAVEERLEEGGEDLRKIEVKELPSDEYDQADDAEIREIIEKSRDETVSSDDIRQLLTTFFDEFGGSITEVLDDHSGDDGNVYSISLPDVLIGDSVSERYEPATFDRELALEDGDLEFIALEHPLVQSLSQYCKDSQRTGGLTGIKVAAHHEETPGILFQFRIECLDGTGKTIMEELVKIYAKAEDTASRGAPELTGGLPAEAAEGHESIQQLLPRAGDFRAVAEEAAQTVALDLVEEVRADRRAEIERRRENTERYFEKRQRTLNERLQSYQQRVADAEEDMQALINKVRHKLATLEDEREAALDQLTTEKTVTWEGPELVNAAVVVAGLD